MKKLFRIAIMYSFLLISLVPGPGCCAEQDSTQFIKDFYTWYISAYNRKDARKSKQIFQYVAKETVEGIEKIPEMPGFDGTDYFIKLDDTPVDMKGVRILVDQVEDLGADTLVATVTIVQIDKVGHRFPDGVIIVVLKKIKGELKIFKCIDAYPEA